MMFSGKKDKKDKSKDKKDKKDKDKKKDKKKDDKDKRKLEKSVTIKFDKNVKDEVKKDKSSSTRTLRIKRSKSRRTDPMPPPEKLMEEWNSLMDDLKIDPEQRKEMDNLSDDAKWTYILGNRKKAAEITDKKGDVKGSPTYFVQVLKETPLKIDEIKSLKLALSTQPMIWYKNFRDLNGTNLLIDALYITSTQESSPNNELELELIRCLKTILSNSDNLNHTILSNNDNLNKIIISLDSPDSRVKTIVMEILSMIVIGNEDFHGKILASFDYLKYKKKMPHRFSSLVDVLKFENDTTIRTLCLMIINGIINTPEDLDERIELRNEFLSLGFDLLISSIKDEVHDSDLLYQIKTYEEDTQQDEDEFLDRIETGKKSLDLRDPQELISTLIGQMKDKPYLHKAFLETMRHLLAMPVDKDKGLKIWHFLGKISHQLSILRDEIKFDEHNILDLEELLASNEDRVELEKMRETLYEANQKFEIELEEMKKQVEQAKLREFEIEEQMKKSLENEVNLMKIKLDERVQEAVEERLKERENEIKAKEEKFRDDLMASKQKEKELLLEIMQHQTLREKLENDIKAYQEQIEQKDKEIENISEIEREKSTKLEEELRKEIKSLNDVVQAKDAEIQSINQKQEKILEEELNKVENDLKIKYEAQIQELSKEKEEYIKKIRESHEEKLKKALEQQKIEHDAEMEAKVSEVTRSLKAQIRSSSSQKNVEIEEKKQKFEDEIKRIETEYEQRIQRNITQLREKQSEFEKLEKLYEDEKDQHEAIQQQYKLLKSKYDDHESMWNVERQKLNDKIQVLEKELKIKDLSIKTLTDEKNSTADELRQIKSKYKFKKENIEKRHKADIIKLEEQLSDLKSQLEKEKQLANQRVENERELAEVQKTSLKAELQAVKKAAEEDKLRSKKIIEELEKQIEAEHKKANESIGEKLKILEIEKLKVERKFESLARQLEEEREKIAKNEKEYEASKMKLGNQLIELREKYTELQHEREFLQEELKNAKEKLNSSAQLQVVTTSSALVEQIEELKQENEALLEKIKILTSEQQSGSRNLGTNTQIEELKAKIASLEKELELAREDASKAKKGRERALEKVKSMKETQKQEENDDSSSDSSSSSSSSSEDDNNEAAVELKRELENVSKQMKEYQEKAAGLSEENEKLNKTISSLNEEIKSLSQKLKDLESTQNTTSTSSSPPPPSEAPAPPPPPPSGGPPPPPPPGGPPPPPSGGPPPPPPPGGAPPPPGGPPPPGAQKAIPKGPQPRVPMRPLQWSKIAPSQASRTIFSKLDFTKVDLDLDTLEEHFGAKPAVKKEVEKKPVKEQLVTRIDPKRLQNVGIFLQTFKLTNDQIKEAILMLDESILTVENTRLLIQNLPDAEERNSLNQYISEGGDVNKLENVDKFFLEMMSIPHVEARMQCYMFKLNFPIKIAEIKPHLLRIKKANLEMNRKCESFHKLLEIVLAVGNYLNFGSNRGSALGIQLNSLSRLTELKSKDNQLNLLEYIIEFVEQKYPDILNWTEDLGNVKFATKVTWSAIRDDMSGLKRGLKENMTKASTIEKGDSKYDVFYRIVPDALVEYEKQFEEIEELFNRVEEDFKQIIVQYGAPTSTVPEEFYSIISSFAAQFEKSHKDLKLKKAKEEKLNKKKELEERKKRLEEEKMSRLTRKESESPSKTSESRRRTLRRDREKEKETPKEEEELEVNIESTISSARTNRVFERRRLRRQDTLREKRKQMQQIRQN